MIKFYSFDDIKAKGIYEPNILEWMKINKLHPICRRTGKKIVHVECYPLKQQYRGKSSDEIIKAEEDEHKAKICALGTRFVLDPRPPIINHNGLNVPLNTIDTPPDCRAIYRFSSHDLEDILFPANEIDALGMINANGRTNIRKAVALEVAKSIKENYPNLTVKEAVKKINEYLKDNKFAEYSEKSLSSIVIKFGFMPGKAGRKRKK